MIGTIRHRGPDDLNFYIAPVVGPPQRTRELAEDGVESFLGIAHARVEIVDLTERGAQPMIDPVTGNVLVFNGEIHNYVELRRELESAGHSFRGDSDTEVLLVAYRQYGSDMFPLLNGMWALAIWDARRQHLVLSRDRFGSKPLYLWRDERTLLFASEIKALLAHSKVTTRINHDTVARYVSKHWRWIDSGRDTFFLGITQLEPASVYHVDRDGKTSSRHFWQLGDHLKVREGLAEEEAVAELRELLIDSVAIRLRADVPVGHLLSGGLDSSTVVGIAAQLTNGPVDTVSARFSEASSDEGKFIHETVSRTDTRAHEVWVDAADALEVIPDVLRHSDEPLNTPSWLAHWKLMQTAQTQGIRVLTDGTGGDELFAGYHSHHVCHLADLEAAGDASFADELTHWKDAFGLNNGDYSAAASRAERLRSAQLVTADPLVNFMTSNSPINVMALGKRVGTGDALRHTMPLLKEEYSQQHPVEILRENPLGHGLLSSHLYQDVVHEALPSSLRPSDRGSMAFGIEIRSPFLDHRLAEFAFSLPSIYRIKDGTSKWLVRRATEGLMPDLVRNRSDKQGINIPSTAWLRGQWAEPFRAVLSSSELAERGILDQSAVISLLDSHVAGEGNYYLHLWHCYNLELWLRQHA